jgi:hypothetical protein
MDQTWTPACARTENAPPSKQTNKCVGGNGLSPSNVAQPSARNEIILLALHTPPIQLPRPFPRHPQSF